MEGRHKALRIPCPKVSTTTGQTEQPCTAEKRPLEKAEERLSCSFQALPGSASSRCRPGAWPKAGSFPRARGQGQGMLGAALAPALREDNKAAALPHCSTAGMSRLLDWARRWPGSSRVWILSPVRIKPSHSWTSHAWLICAGPCQP